MSTSAGSQRAVNYLERRADFSALDALVSKRRGIDALRMNAETGWPSLAPIKVRGPQYSASYCVGGCNSAVASASTTSYSSGSGQASKFDPDWFRIGSPAPKRSGSASSKNKKKSHPKNKSSTVPSDKKKSQPKDKELSVKGDKQKSLSKKSLSKKSLAKDERMHMHADNKHIPTSKLGDTSSRTNDVILKDNEAAALRRRLERKVSRERETRSIRKARLRSMVRSVQFSSKEDLDPALLEHTDDEEHIYHYPYCANAESQFVITIPQPRSRSRRSHATPHTSQSTQRRQTNAPNGVRSVARVKSGRTNYRACKRSLLRWMAQTMCKQPLTKHY